MLASACQRCLGWLWLMVKRERSRDSSITWAALKALTWCICGQGLLEWLLQLHVVMCTRMVACYALWVYLRAWRGLKRATATERYILSSLGCWRSS